MKEEERRLQERMNEKREGERREVREYHIPKDTHITPTHTRTHT